MCQKLGGTLADALLLFGVRMIIVCSWLAIVQISLAVLNGLLCYSLTSLSSQGEKSPALSLVFRDGCTLPASDSYLVASAENYRRYYSW